MSLSDPLVYQHLRKVTTAIQHLQRLNLNEILREQILAQTHAHQAQKGNAKPEDGITVRMQNFRNLSRRADLNTCNKLHADVIDIHGTLPGCCNAIALGLQGVELLKGNSLQRPRTLRNMYTSFISTMKWKQWNEIFIFAPPQPISLSLHEFSNVSTSLESAEQIHGTIEDLCNLSFPPPSMSTNVFRFCSLQMFILTRYTIVTRSHSFMIASLRIFSFPLTPGSRHSTTRRD